jgi:hypothetical protein
MRKIQKGNLWDKTCTKGILKTGVSWNKLIAGNRQQNSQE